MIHPAEYELQEARHTDYLYRAALQRQIAEAVRSVAEDSSPQPHFHATILACLRWSAAAL